MLKLFRNIRKSLLVQGHLKKYLAYAIGEILLVMVGILLALQVSNWNDRVQDNAKEREYLLSLQNDLIADTLSLDAILGQVRAAQRGAITVIETFTDGQREVSDTLELFKALRIAGYMRHFETNSATFDDLRSTGNLKIIKNLELKKAISSYYTVVESAKNYRPLWQDRIWGDYLRERNQFVNQELNAFWSNGFDRDEGFSVVLPTRFAVAPEASRPFLQSVYDVVEMQSFRQTTFRGIKGRAAELIGRLSAELAGG